MGRNETTRDRRQAGAPRAFSLTKWALKGAPAHAGKRAGADETHTHRK